jgi:hypothetical protein
MSGNDRDEWDAQDLLGFAIGHASRLDLETVETVALPVKTLRSA